MEACFFLAISEFSIFIFKKKKLIPAINVNEIKDYRYNDVPLFEYNK